VTYTDATFTVSFYGTKQRRKVVDVGCTAVMPHLFGVPGRDAMADGTVRGLGYMMRSLVPACISREFTVLDAETGAVRWTRPLDSMQTRVYDGWIMFPSAWVNLRLHEVGPYYTLIGFGTITWHHLTINLDTWNRLPEEVQEIMLEVAADFEEEVGRVNRERYERDIETLRGLINVNEIDDAVRQEWAESLSDWPQQIANELDARGLPASEVLKLTLDAAEKHGHEWPYRYEIE
jgi:hypothetical protein